MAEEDKERKKMARKWKTFFEEEENTSKRRVWCAKQRRKYQHRWWRDDEDECDGVKKIAIRNIILPPAVHTMLFSLWYYLNDRKCRCLGVYLQFFSCSIMVIWWSAQQAAGEIKMARRKKETLLDAGGGLDWICRQMSKKLHKQHNCTVCAHSE